MNWKKKRINNSCIGAIHGFLLWNLSASHHLSVLHILFSVEDVVILELNNTIFCQDFLIHNSMSKESWCREIQGRCR